jgi:hypothetical protein
LKLLLPAELPQKMIDFCFQVKKLQQMENRVKINGFLNIVFERTCTGVLNSGP